MSRPVPVVLFIYNRPEVTLRNIAALRAVAPAKLIVVADGPRHQRPGDAERCEATRAAVRTIDWSCEVTTDFAADNMGCSRRIASGIGAVLEREEAAIFMEDDCIASPSFFRFAEELLERYANDDRIAGVSGDNFQFGRKYGDTSYFFTRFPHCWGWATWARAWRDYDRDMTGWETFRSSRWLEREFGARGADYWRDRLDAALRGTVDSWAYRWTYACWKRDRLTIVPQVNLVANHGFGGDASHTRGVSALDRMPVGEVAFPLRHPLLVERNVAADRRTEKHVFEHPRLLWIDRLLSR